MTFRNYYYFWGRIYILGQKLLFDERPKSTREDLFDREAEIEDLKRNINRPLIVLKGIRRIGKTSILQVALNELGVPYFILDCRKLRENYSRADLYSLFSEGLSSILDKVKDVLKRVKGIGIAGGYVEIRWKGKDYVSLADLFDHLNEKRLIIAIDEAQKLRGPLSNEIKEAIAHAYDYDKSLTFILTGSEVGLLEDFIGVEDSSSPLYGRYFHVINVERFDKEKSSRFLREGFSQLSVRVSDAIIQQIVDFFDGIPGWLVFAGNSYVSRRSLEEVKEIAISVGLQELRNFVESKSNGKRYAIALRCIAEGGNSWSKLLSCMQREEGSTISSSVLDNLLRNLEKYSFVKDYSFLDPVYEEAAKRLRF